MSRRLTTTPPVDPAATASMPTEDAGGVGPWLYHAAFERAAIGMCSCDSTGRFVRANRRFCELTGYDEAELTRRSFADITHPDDLDSNLRLVEELRSGRRDTVSIEKRYLRPDGEAVWSRTTLSLVHQPGKPARYVIATAEDISARKQAELQLAANAQRTENILASISDGYFTLSRDWVYTEINTRAAELVGKTREQLLGRRIWDVFPDAEHSIWRQRYQQVMETGQPHQVVAHYPALDRWYAARMSPCEGGVAVSFHDVTEQHRLEADLRASEARLRSVQRIAGVGSWDLDLATMRVTLDEVAAEIYGVDLAQFDGTYAAFINLVEPRDRGRIRKADALAIETGRPAENHYQIVTPSGAVRDLVERSAPGFDSGGKRRSVRSTVQDVTELHRIESALRESESLLRQGAQLARFGTWMWDATEDRCVYCSEELAALFGLSVREFMLERGSTRQMLGASPPEDRAAFEAMMSLAIGETYDVEFRAWRKDGELRHFREVGRTFRDAATGHIHSLGVTQDITAIKQTEQELRRMVVEASRLQQLAEEASRAKSAFLATMSHELRTPLNAVIGFSEMLLTLDGALSPEKIRDYHVTIRDSGRHLLDVISDILDLAKVEAGKTEVSLEEVDVAAVVGECARYLQALARERQVAIATEIANGRLRSDRRLLKQVILNLMSNAVKFNQAGGSVAVSARCEGERMLFTIADTGAGMTDEEIRRALQPFVQLEPAYYRRQEGTGLGLALVERFARLLGGTFEIRSQKGKGTTACLSLPLKGPSRGEASA
ncbi:MAG TPA: PAS domain S-box protein [Candidatus Cybelea sp.]|nr:PAS domain S-box protein [Candidatus Cybelea sp.]